MDIDYIRLAELEPGDRPYKAYRILLENGYVRLMSSRLCPDGTVVSINYYGKPDKTGRALELTRVTDKRQRPEDFEADLASFRKMIESAGMTIEITSIGTD